MHNILIADKNNSMEIIEKIKNEKNINILNSHYNVENFNKIDTNIIIINITGTDLIKYEKSEIFNEITLRKEIYNLLLKMKIHKNDYVGIPYLVDAIVLCYYDDTLLSKGLKEVYKKIELKKDYNISCNQIKWSIDNIFKSYNNNINIKNMYNIFPYYDNTKPLSPKYFISLAIEYLFKKRF